MCFRQPGRARRSRRNRGGPLRPRLRARRRIHAQRSGKQAAEYLGAAARTGHEFRDATYVWPRAFSDLTDVYDERYGIDYRHIGRIAEINLENAKRNPNAQTRKWVYGPKSFSEDDEANPRIEGRVRRNDCAQVTDGAAAIFLASRDYAAQWADRNGIDLETVPRILGWGHRSATIMFKDKIAASEGKPHVFPHVRGTIQDAFKRANIGDVFELDAIETHDCFAVTEYMAIEHFGITAPGEAWKAVEDNTIAFGGQAAGQSKRRSDRPRSSGWRDRRPHGA